MADASLLLRMRSQGGRQVAADVRGVREEAKRLGTDTARSSSMGSRALGGLSRSTSALGSAFSKVGRESVSSLGVVGRGISKIGSGVSKTTGGVTHALEKLRGGMEGISKFATGAGVAGIAGFFGVEAIQKAMEGVQQLAEGATALHSVAGLSQDSSVQLVATANAIGISTQKLGVSLKTMSTQATAATSGTKASQKSFKALGISMDDLKATGGDTQKIFNLVAEGLEKTKGSAAKTTAAAKLLGRGWIALNPLLEGGGKEMRSLEKFAGKLGITLSGNTGKNLAKARDAGYRFHLVMMAAQLFIVNKLVPALIKVGGWFNSHVIPAVKSAAGWIRDHLVPAFQAIASWIGKHVLPALRDMKGALGPIAGAVAAAFVVSKISGFGSAILGLVAATGPVGLLLAGLASAVALSSQLNQSINLPAGTSAAGTASALNKAGAGFAIPQLIPKLNKQGAFVTPAQGGAGPPILPAPRKNVARARGAAAAATQIIIQPFPVHTSVQIGRKEIGKASVMAGAEAKAVR